MQNSQIVGSTSWRGHASYFLQGRGCYYKLEMMHACVILDRITIQCHANYVLLWAKLIIAWYCLASYPGPLIEYLGTRLGIAVHTIDIKFSSFQLTETMCKLIGYHNC